MIISLHINMYIDMCVYFHMYNIYQYICICIYSRKIVKAVLRLPRNIWGKSDRGNRNLINCNVTCLL